MDSEPLQPQMDTIVFATQQLKSTDTKAVTIHNTVIRYLLMLHLPALYSTLHQVLATSDSAKITSKWVTDQVIAKKHHQIMQSGESAIMFFAKAKKGNSGSSGTGSLEKCAYCRKLGHKKADCHKWQRDKEKKKEEVKAAGNTSGNSNSKPANSGGNSNTTAKIAVATTPGTCACTVTGFIITSPHIPY